jgi:hypothetical protein
MNREQTRSFCLTAPHRRRLLAAAFPRSTWRRRRNGNRVDLGDLAARTARGSGAQSWNQSVLKVANLGYYPAGIVWSNPTVRALGVAATRNDNVALIELKNWELQA